MRARGFLRTRVARRMLGLFLAGALLPLLLLAFLGYRHLARELGERAREQLRIESKSAGMILLDRLAGLAAALERLASRSGTPGYAVGLTAQSTAAVQAPRFQSVFREYGDGRLETLTGEEAPLPPIDSRMAAHLALGEVGLITASGSREPQVFLVLLADDGGHFWGLVDGSTAWGDAPDRRLAPQDYGVCLVTATGTAINCPETAARDATTAPDDGSIVTWGPRGSRYLAGHWTIFLGRGFAAPSWRIVLSLPERVVYAPLAALRYTLVIGLLLALAVVFALTHIALRRQTAPLEALEAATHRVAEGRFDEPVLVQSNDEFGTLARAFNSMSRDLGAQFEAQRALQQQLDQLNWETLTAFARTIDAVSPWTAGHSERVTIGALEIGRRLGLSDEDLELLHRGGLLHDIGKVGVPAGILDKPTRLEVAEYEQIKQHPSIGARILAPIGALQRALPLVLHHHELLDGSGYPAGLKGEEIPPLVRILTVADVFDALVSDRPYRAAWPVEQAIAHLRENAGTKFDAAAVEVLAAATATGWRPVASGAPTSRTSGGEPVPAPVAALPAALS